MTTTTGHLRPFLRVALPVAVASVLVSLALVNIALVKTWRGELEDGVLWQREGTNVVAAEVAPDQAGARAGIRPRDVVLLIEGHEIQTPGEVVALLHAANPHQPLRYMIQRSSEEMPLTIALQALPEVRHGLYYSLALVGILTIAIGASVRLRRPTDLATLHFFWVTVAFFGALAFTASGRYDRLDYFFDWADTVARLMLPPLFLHFALVFPERPNAWVRSRVGRAILPLAYAPAAVLGAARIAVVSGLLPGVHASGLLTQIEWVAYLYLSLCLAGGLLLIMRALRRLRSVTAQRQLRWIVWGAAVGAVPFLSIYVIPLLLGRPPGYAEYTAVLLGCVPLSFASALVRYRLMDIEVIIKKGLVIAAVVVLLAMMYGGTLRLVSLVLGADNERSSFWALLATLIVALVAPSLWNAIQTALDRLYYRDRYDYRRALVSFARELNSDLDLDRLSSTLVSRIRETLGVDHIALFLSAEAHAAELLIPVVAGGMPLTDLGEVAPSSLLGSRLRAGQTVVVDDVVPSRRLPVDEAARWRDVGLYAFVPCVSNEVTVGTIALGHRPNGEPLNSEDMALLGAVAAQAATALENARLYKQLSGKASEIERLRQFSDSVVESLTDGLLVVDMSDRVLRWNRRMQNLLGVASTKALGSDLSDLFSRSFVETLQVARRESPAGTTLYRVPLDTGTVSGEERRQLLVNTAIAPFETRDESQAGWIIVFEDITERANLEEQLRLSEKMAAIGLLAAGVAHEVNTPLTGISSFTQMLLEKADPDDPATHLLEKIEQQTFRAAKIVNSLLNLSRPSGGEMKLVDLNGVISDVLSLLEHQFRTNRIQVRKHLEGPAVLVLGTEYKLQQVFLNLFLNARDAMPKGGWLSVTTAVSESEALAEVSDTGAGIPSEHLSRIYDPFFTTKSDARGTGLGLSVSYGIVQEHGGTLTCESDIDQGTCFRLVLPAAARETRDTAGAVRL
ncbi:MAG: ATP-binding protein [Vicinamibacterales bacterium]